MQRFDVFVVGGGATGSELGFTLGRRGGLKVGLAERDKLGGECNHYGCVPSKAMLRSARVAATARDAARFGVRVAGVDVDFPAVMARVRGIVENNVREGSAPFERMGISFHPAEVRLVGPHRLETAAGDQIEADKIVLCTGTEATAPPIPGLDAVPYWTNREAIWEPRSVPSSLAILGSGPIGIEFAQIYARFGARVTVIEVVDRILPPEDADSASALVPALERDGIALLTGVKTTKVQHGPQGFQLVIEGRAPVEVERLLVATGRRPCFDEHDLDAAGIKLERGRPLLTDTLRTTGEQVWCAGDATGDLLFVHVGDYEAAVVANDIWGTPFPADYRVVPKVTFCEPEVASVGLSEQGARDAGHEVVTAINRFDDSERAHIEGATDGLAKLVADARTGELLGGHIVGEGAGEMIHEIVTAMAGRTTARTLAGAIHAYPTLSQTLHGAFIALAGKLGGEMGGC